MFVALLVALLAVGLGLLLGLAPAAGRRAFGPLRTLAFTAVLAVVGLHLLPEALGELRATGLLVFAVAVALPRWLKWLPKREASEGRVGLELGYWALLVHHVGDGLALGAYGRVGDSGNRHVDVLLALVLHTVPLVAVVAAGYAQTAGARAAVQRSAGLALASALGVLLTGFVPEAVVAGAQAWIAAGVSGLLLHGLMHDLGRDLPEDRRGRAFDLLLGLCGAGLGWLGMRLEAHADPRSSPMWLYLSSGFERVALPFMVGLLLSALPALWQREETADVRAARPEGPLGAEGFLVTMASFGLLFAVVRDVLGALGALLLGREEPGDGDAVMPQTVAPGRRFLRRLSERFDALVGWCFAGVVVAALIQSALPNGALGATRWVALAAALVFALSVPLHAVAASELAAALFGRGFPAAGAFLITAVSPLGARRPNGPVLGLAFLGALAAYLFGDALPGAPLWVPPSLAEAAAILLLVFTLVRAHQVGVRRLLLALKRPLLRDGNEPAALHVERDA